MMQLEQVIVTLSQLPNLEINLMQAVVLDKVADMVVVVVVVVVADKVAVAGMAVVEGMLMDQDESVEQYMVDNHMEIDNLVLQVELHYIDHNLAYSLEMDLNSCHNYHNYCYHSHLPVEN